MYKKIQKKRKNRKAFTFVEVLVATLLVAIVMTALGSMMALSARVAESNEMKELAQLKAQQSMEFFRRERLIRGWNIFYANLANGVYCINDLPDHIQNIEPGSCPVDNPMSDFNLFYYNVEVVVLKTPTPSAESIEIEINIYRYSKSGVYLGDGDAFLSVSQIFKQY